MTSTWHTIQVAAASRRYEVRVAAALLQNLGTLVESLSISRRVHLVVDDCLPPSVIEAARSSFVGTRFVVTVSTVHADEPHKSIDSARAILQQLLTSKHERKDPIIAIGGGIVTDLAGFVAATYQRGVPIIQCPTTLLAMVDASVGGKTGVNLALADGKLVKNMVGCFWQPHLVLADTDTLKTLPPRHLRAGLAECLKHGLISAGLPDGQGRDSSLWTWTLANLDQVLSLDSGALTELIARNVAVKAGVVGVDEREEAPSSQGGRALLNLGHTFGHAIETIAGLSPSGDPKDAPLHHGEAVAYGLIAAAEASCFLGMIGKSDADAVRAAVSRLGLSRRLAGLPPDDAIIASMMHDKKVAGGKLRLVLPTSLGASRVIENPAIEAVKAGLAAIRA